MKLTALIAAAFAAGGLCAVLLLLFIWPLQWSAREQDDLAALKVSFRRPDVVPFPADNAFSEKKRALGESLFNDSRLSLDHSLTCASCHEADKGFADPRPRSLGVPGRPLGRHSPTLWNLAFARNVFWDGRARSIEEQVLNPIQATDEMALPLDMLVARLSADAATAKAFADTFPDDPNVTVGNLVKALATYVRTLVSPPTRFDRWIAGDRKALAPGELRGFRIFTGKAGCANCHSGFSFTDYAFHDIGLPDDDRGRGAVLRLPAAEHAFKTPTLREIGRSAPYMHDGSLATIEDVLDHYEHGIVERETLSKDLRRNVTLAPSERVDLIAFLAALTSEGEAQPAKITPGEGAPRSPAVNVNVISQHDKMFSPSRVALRAGDRLWFLNNDSRTHNVRVFHPDLDFDSGAQEPGETVEIAFPEAGEFLVYCGIHPTMELNVEVGPAVGQSGR